MARNSIGFLCALLIWFGSGSGSPQTLDKNTREHVRVMAGQALHEIQKNYYDRTFHDVDLQARFATADERIRQAASLGQALGAIAEAIEGLNDSHTFFVPPPRPIRRDPGYVWRIVGDACFITAVRPGSDASRKLGAGDEVVAVQGLPANRQVFWKLDYSVNELFALPVVAMNLRRPDGAPGQAAVAADIRQEKRVLNLTDGVDLREIFLQVEDRLFLNRQRFLESDEVMIWKMPRFNMTEEGVDRMIKKARSHPALILDLRGNPGGAVTTVEALVGGVMDHNVTIATRQGRKANLKPVVAKSLGANVFPGKLVVLIDAGSASAAEIFARVVQLEHRGTVLGDRSSGSVMESLYHPLSQSAGTISYGLSITEADVIMGDGKTLEHTGVTPDEIILPTAADMAAGRDPVLARAAWLLGVELDPAAAGKMFPVEWRTE